MFWIWWRLKDCCGNKRTYWPHPSRATALSGRENPSAKPRCGHCWSSWRPPPIPTPVPMAVPPCSISVLSTWSGSLGGVSQLRVELMVVNRLGAPTCHCCENRIANLRAPTSSFRHQPFGGRAARNLRSILARRSRACTNGLFALGGAPQENLRLLAVLVVT